MTRGNKGGQKRSSLRGRAIRIPRARYYDPKAGRFLQRDPIGFAGGVNVHSYTLNNPVNRIDPYGLCTPCDECPSGLYHYEGLEYGGFLYFIGVKSAHLRLTCVGKSDVTFTLTITSIYIGGGLGAGVGIPNGIAKGCNNQDAENAILGWTATVTFMPPPVKFPPNPGWGASGSLSGSFGSGNMTPGWGWEVSGGGGYSFKVQ